MPEKTLTGVLRHIHQIAAVQTGREQSDGTLLDQFIHARDEAAFSVLVERYGPLVLGVCRRILGHADDADDAFQATFLVFARKAASIRRSAALGGWLRRVARSVASNARRERTRRQHREGACQPAVSQERASDIDWHEVHATLDQELQRLPEHYRVPLLLCYIEGQTRDEVSRRLGLSLGVLHGRLERGRGLLRDRLLRRGVTLTAPLLALALGESSTQAAVSPTAVLATSRAALQFARGSTPTVSAQVLSLAREAMKSMFLGKLKLAAAAVLCTGLFVAAAGGFGRSADPAMAVSSPRPEPAQAAGKDAGPAEDPVAKAIRDLQGEWQAVAIEANGKRDTSSDEVTDLRLLFQRDQIILKNVGVDKSRKLKFKLDPTKSPRSIDLISLDGPDKLQTVAAIYALSKGQLRICQFRAGSRRPTDFTTRPGDDRVVIVLERVGTKKPGAAVAPGKRPGDQAASDWKAIQREWQRGQDDFWDAYSKAKTPDQRSQLQAARRVKAASLAERCLKHATMYPDHPAALAALWWAAGLAPDTASGQKARALLKNGRIARADLEDLFRAVAAYGPAMDRVEELLPAVLERVKQKLDQRRAARLVAWVCSRSFHGKAKEIPPYFAQAAELIMAHCVDSPDIANFCEVLAPASGNPPPWAGKYEPHLRTILAKNKHRLVRLTARYALASVILNSSPARQDEAVKLFERFLEDFDGSDPQIASVEKELLHVARARLGEIQFRAVGKTAPEIEGIDLEGRPMKLSNYRGKVVLLSFWATNCFPCLKLIPHERDLVTRLQGKRFVLVGVNSDGDVATLANTLKTQHINWRSFRDRRANKPAISDEWQVLGYPTLYLIDRQGIIRQRWIGSPPPEELNRAIDQLVEAASPTN
jgi:RNA polymerase sigma-70 factor (ECF subfamily)